VIVADRRRFGQTVLDRIDSLVAAAQHAEVPADAATLGELAGGAGSLAGGGGPLAGAALLSDADVSDAVGWPVEAARAFGRGAVRFRGGGVAIDVTLTESGQAARRVAARGLGRRLPGIGGGGVAIDVTLTESGQAARRVAARGLGRRLPGIGDEAWLIKGDHTAVVRVGARTAKILLIGLPPAQRAQVLVPLARLVAARLGARQASR
jgi:hypothetical protein